MKLKITQTILLLCLMVSCSVGPTAFLADGSRVTLGGSLASKADADARQATLPNGMALNWVRTNVDETSVPNTAIGVYGASKIAGHAASSYAAGQKTAQVKAVEGTKQIQSTNAAAVDKAALGTAVPGTSNVTTSGASVVNPAPTGL